MKRALMLSVVGLLVLFAAPMAYAHCEVPCGIYDDPMRADLIAEHARTIEKSMNQIKELREDEDKNYNQLVRWINNKEQHARKLQEIVWQYFMTQRIKPAEGSGKERQKYVREVTLLHQMLVEAMKCKQTTDLKHVENLRTLLAAFRKSYFGETGEGAEKMEHEHEGSATKHQGSGHRH